MREKGFKSLAQLDDFIKKSADKRQNLQNEIKVLDEKIATLSATMEQVHTVMKYRQIYQAYKKEPTDKAFPSEHKSQILLYEKALTDLKKSYSKMPNSKQIFEELEKLNEKRIPLCKNILPQNPRWSNYIKSEKTTRNIWGKRWRGRFILPLLYYLKYLYA